MVELTVLNTMASSDFVCALERHLEWSLKLLDLKDLVFGKRIVDLTAAEAARERWFHASDESVREASEDEVLQLPQPHTVLCCCDDEKQSPPAITV